MNHQYMVYSHEKKEYITRDLFGRPVIVACEDCLIGMIPPPRSVMEQVAETDKPCEFCTHEGENNGR